MTALENDLDRQDNEPDGQEDKSLFGSVQAQSVANPGYNFQSTFPFASQGVSLFSKATPFHKSVLLQNYSIAVVWFPVPHANKKAFDQRYIAFESPFSGKLLETQNYLRLRECVSIWCESLL